MSSKIFSCFFFDFFKYFFRYYFFLFFPIFPGFLNIFFGLEIHYLEIRNFCSFEKSNFSKDNLYFFTFSKCDLDSFCLENIDSLKEFLDLRKSSVKVGQVTFFSIFSTLVSSIFRDKCWTAYCICQPYILRRNIHKNKK